MKCHVAPKHHVTPSLVATQQLEDNECRSMMNSAGQTKSDVYNSLLREGEKEMGMNER